MRSVPSISALTAGISLSACTQARTKKPMKPSFTPCFFSNRSLYCARSAMTWPMSTSLKVVSMAAVFCASLSRRAMVCRSRVIFTRSSRAASSAGGGERSCTDAAGRSIGVGAAAARSIAAIISPLVTRPSLPDPGTVDASTPVSAASLRTEGASGVFASGGGRGSSCAASIGAAGAVFWSGRPSRTALSATAAPSLICPSSAPTATVSPSLAAMSARTPAAGAGTSIVTLSVSSSTSGSSTATASPGCLNHLPMVASVTDSPSAGTRISAMSHPSYVDVHARTADEGRAHPKSSVVRPLLAQGFIEQRLELLEVLRHLAGRGRRRGGTAGINRLPVFGSDLVEHPFEIRLHEGVRAHIARLLLAPHEFRLLEAAELVHQRLKWHRIELLEAQ